MEDSVIEYIDLYDKRRLPTSLTHKRGDKLPEGLRYLVVRVWVVNSGGNFLITRRAFCKSWKPGAWECPGGSALAGEDSLTAALRETAEETGIVLGAANAELFCSYLGEEHFVDHWLFRQDFSIGDIKLDPRETIDARVTSWAEVAKMRKSGEFINNHLLDFDPFSYLKSEFGESN